MSHHPRERISRRRVLAAGTAGVVGAAAALTGHAQTADTTRVQGPGTTDVGARSPFVTPKRQSFSPRRTASTTPLQDLEGIITPADLHFERHHGGVPAIDPATYSLLVHGLVDRPTVFTLDDLKRFPGRVGHPLPRVFGQRQPQLPARSEGARDHAAAARRAHELQRVDRRAAGHRAARGRRLGEGDVVPGRVDGRGRARAQHPDGEGARRRDAGLRAERRGAAARAGLSGAPVPARATRARPA